MQAARKRWMGVRNDVYGRIMWRSEIKRLFSLVNSPQQVLRNHTYSRFRLSLCIALSAPDKDALWCDNENKRRARIDVVIGLEIGRLCFFLGAPGLSVSKVLLLDRLLTVFFKSEISKQILLGWEETKESF